MCIRDRSYDYLWINLRVKGGAYGCMSGFGRSGEGYLTSYRDPNLKETNEIYEGIVEYLEHFDVDDRDMTKYVIGTISDMDLSLIHIFVRKLSMYDRIAFPIPINGIQFILIPFHRN